MKRKLYTLIAVDILLTLSFYPFDLYFFAFVFLIPLIYLIEEENKHYFLYPTITGTIFNMIHLFWILFLSVPGWEKILLFLGWILLGLYLGVWWGLSFLITKKILKRIYFLPIVWAILEFIRGEIPQIGFPWAALGYSQIKNLPILQIASFSSVYGISFFIVLINILLYIYITNRKRIIIIGTLGLYIITSIYGFYAVKKYENKTLPYKIGIIQGNILPNEKQHISVSRWQRYISMTEEAIKERCKIIIWPETAYPGYIALNRHRREYLQSLCDSFDVDILIGSLSLKYNNNKREYYNSAYLFSPYKDFQTYHKRNLVPFGEHIPFDNYFPQLANIDLGQGNFSSGKEYIILKDKMKIGVLICFESIFFFPAKEESQRGCDILVNITEDSWFDRHIGPTQHFRMAILRSVENRKFLIRAANTGISAVISPYGKILKKTNLFKQAILYYGGQK